MSNDPTAQQRLVSLVAMTELEPSGAELADYLTDADPSVRRTAIDVLGESVPDDAGAAIAPLLLDPDESVRTAAIAALGDLREVVQADASFVRSLELAARSPFPEVRAAVVSMWVEHRIGSLEQFTTAGTDPVPTVRIRGIAGLVSLNAVEELSRLRVDPDPLVRLAVARGVATVGDPTGITVLEDLSSDPDLRVRAAAIEGFAALGLGLRAESIATRGLRAPEWEVRKAAALALAHAGPDVAVQPLLAMVQDENQDVRKATVQALAKWCQTIPEVRTALEACLTDPDADVRGFARLGIG